MHFPSPFRDGLFDKLHRNVTRHTILDYCLTLRLNVKKEWYWWQKRKRANIRTLNYSNNHPIPHPATTTLSATPVIFSKKNLVNRKEKFENIFTWVQNPKRIWFKKKWMTAGYPQPSKESRHQPPPKPLPALIPLSPRIKLKKKASQRRLFTKKQ